MKNKQRILAWIGIILLAAMVIFFFISAFFIKDPVYFRAALGCIILLPVLLYAILMMAKLLTPKKSPFIDAIIFDVGNVLISFEWRQVMINLGFSKETIAFLDQNLIHDPLWNEFDEGIRPYSDVLDEFCKKYPEYESQIRTFISHLHESITLRPHVHSWLADLKAKGYQLYILSNWSAPLYENTKNGALSFEKIMDGAIWSYQVQCIKPDKKIYQLLLDTYDLDPARCVFIDDRQENLDGAAQLGIHTVLVTPNHTNTLKEFEKLGIK